MELKEGMYVRYIPTMGQYTQKISKITKIKNCMLYMAYYLDNLKKPVFSSHFDDILKASYDIIDLIEVGDYIEYKQSNIYWNIPTRVTGRYNRQQWIKELIVGEIPLKDVEITSVVTKEQFEEISYKVNGDDE